MGSRLRSGVCCCEVTSYRRPCCQALGADQRPGRGVERDPGAVDLGRGGHHGQQPAGEPVDRDALPDLGDRGGRQRRLGGQDPPGVAVGGADPPGDAVVVGEHGEPQPEFRRPAGEARPASAPGDTSSRRSAGLSAQPEIRFSGLSSRASTCGGSTYRRGSTGVAETWPPTHGPTRATSPTTTASPAAAPASARPRTAARVEAGTSAEIRTRRLILRLRARPRRARRRPAWASPPRRRSGRRRRARPRRARPRARSRAGRGRRGRRSRRRPDRPARPRPPARPPCPAPTRPGSSAVSSRGMPLTSGVRR